MRRLRPSRPKPQSVVMTSCSGGMYSSALRIRPATCSAGSTTVLQWLTTPMPIFLSVLYLPKSARSLPSLLAHSKVITSAFSCRRCGSAPGELAVEGLRLEFEILVGALRQGGQPVMARLLDLDHRAAGGGQFLELGVHDVAEIEHQRVVVVVMLVPQHRGERRRADRAELDRAIGKALRHLPDRGVFERPAAEFFGDDTGLIGLLHLPKDLAGPEAVALHPAARGVAVAGNAEEALDRIEKPRLAANREVEAAVAVGDDVEPGSLLRVDHRGDGVEILLAKQGVAQHRLERTPGEVRLEP